MARTNTSHTQTKLHTHEGAPATRISALEQLRRSVLACLLWEDTFYEDGQAIADRIVDLVGKVKPSEAAAVAVEARTQMHLRHVPLLVTRALTKTHSGDSLVSDTLEQIIQRPDELAEFLSIYWANGREPLSAQVKKGLARAFAKFDAYQVAKWDQKSAGITLRDVMFMVHAKPADEKQAEIYRQLADQSLAYAKTWENEMIADTSGENAGRKRTAEDKRTMWERMLSEEKLGYMALIKNLRGMNEAGVDHELIRKALRAGKGARKVLPFRFVAAYRHAPMFADALNEALLARLGDMQTFEGKTILLVDVSGSMNYGKLSGKSEMTRLDAACALAALWPGDARVFSFSNDLVECPNFKGLPMIEKIRNSQFNGGTYLGASLRELNRLDHRAQRLVVITDEQSHDKVIAPTSFPRRYMINIAANQNGVGYRDWVHMDGFSENIFRFIEELERL